MHRTVTGGGVVRGDTSNSPLHSNERVSTTYFVNRCKMCPLIFYHTFVINCYAVSFLVIKTQSNLNKFHEHNQGRFYVGAGAHPQIHLFPPPDSKASWRNVGLYGVGIFSVSENG